MQKVLSEVQGCVRLVQTTNHSRMLFQYRSISARRTILWLECKKQNLKRVGGNDLRLVGLRLLRARQLERGVRMLPTALAETRTHHILRGMYC